MKRLLAKLLPGRRVAADAPPDTDVLDVVAATAALFQQHGVSTVTAEGAILLSDQRCRLTPAVVSEDLHDTWGTCRLDVRVALPDESVIVESFAGVGSDSPTARRDAFENFVRSSFHVLLRGIVLPVPDEQVEVEEWRVGEHRYIATIGGVTVRPPSRGWVAPTEWFTTFETAVKAARLPRKLCWIRFYYGHMNDATDVVEVLLNNEPWPELAKIMERVAWPPSDAFYSLRLFLILRPAA